MSETIPEEEPRTCGVPLTRREDTKHSGIVLREEYGGPGRFVRLPKSSIRRTDLLPEEEQPRACRHCGLKRPKKKKSWPILQSLRVLAVKIASVEIDDIPLPAEAFLSAQIE